MNSENNTPSAALKAPLSFSMMQNNASIFLQINLDTKEFNEAQAEPELVVVPDDQANDDDEQGENGEGHGSAAGELPTQEEAAANTNEDEEVKAEE